MSKKHKKNVSTVRKSVPTNQKKNTFKNTFLLDGKIKLAVAGVSQIERKKMVSTS